MFLVGPNRGSSPPDLRLAGIAKHQFGVASREQLLAHGFSYKMVRERVERGNLEPLFPRTFLVGGAPLSWEARLLAAQLSLGPRAAVSHRSSAAYQGLEAFAPGPLELTLSGSGRARIKQVRIHRSTVLAPTDLVRVGPFQVTRPERLMIELAHVVSPRLLEAALDSVLFKGLSTYPRISDYLSRVRRKGLVGVQALSDLLDARDPDQAPAESLFETDFYRLLKASRWSDALFQYEIFDGDGFVARLDIAYPEKLVGIEAQGLRYHSPRERLLRDRARNNRLLALGWRVLYETYDDLVERPSEVLGRLEQLLTA